MSAESTPTWTGDNPDVDERTLDRLAEGMLGPGERRAVLMRLEATPGGWRRCALAFLEAQAWREALGGLAVGAVTTRPPAASVPPLAPLPARGRPGWPAWTARAAAVLAAFVLGAWAGPRLGGPGAPSAPIVVQQRPEPVADPPSPAVAPETDASLAATAPAPRAEPDAAAPPEPTRDLLTQLQSELAPRGFRVEPRGAYVPVAADDSGRTVRVPTEGYRVRFVGNRIY
jgi:hypothetical protein